MKRTNFVLVFGIISGFIGKVAAFWYISWIAAAILIVSGILAFIIYTSTEDLDNKLQSKQTEQH